MLTVLWWKSRQKMLLMLVAIAAIPAVLLYLPEHWYQRMDTITDFEQDNSASARLNAWATMFHLAEDRPVVGGGFDVAEAAVYEKYAPDQRFHAQVAHSIYFQALGEHGFVGLGFYLLLYLVFWRYAGGLARLGADRPESEWARDFGLMTQVCLTGFLVGGAFISLVNFDVPYYLIGTLVASRRLLEPDTRATAALRAGASTSLAPARTNS